MTAFAESFFSLDQFAHRDLWKSSEPVWAPLHRLKEYLIQKNNYRIDIEVPSGVFLEKPELISIGEGTIIEPGTYIQGPCIIGKNCWVRNGAYIREFVICGEECTIGHCSELKHSILLNKSAASHFVYVGDSIIGNEANLGAGVKCANLRLDHSEVSVILNGRKEKTGLRKLGAILGDRVQIGCNSVINPGTLVGKDCVCYPLTNLSGFIPESSQITSKGVKILEKKLCRLNTTAPA